MRQQDFDAIAKATSLLEKAGLRRTQVRLEVLRLLAQSRQPLDVAQILARLPEHTDAVTVYRTLNSFTRNKLIHRVRYQDRSWRYAFGDEQEHKEHRHPHFVCEGCGKVQCLNGVEIPVLFAKSLRVPRGYKISYPEVVLHGRCPKCP